MSEKCGRGYPGELVWGGRSVSPLELSRVSLAKLSSQVKPPFPSQSAHVCSGCMPKKEKKKTTRENPALATSCILRS